LTLLLVLDLCGVFVFGLSGGLLAVRKQLDVVGVVVLAGFTGLGGGVLRDLLIGRAPPRALDDWRYLAVAAGAAAVVFALHSYVERRYRFVQLFDAAGLALFTVTGADVALRADIDRAPAVLIGVLTGVGGGALRDVLAREVPFVLQRGEFYALASLAGAAFFVTADYLDAPRTSSAIAAAAAVFALRMASVYLGWTSPGPLDRRKRDAD
jgi:uncharacterized membrane protein YeiH